LLVLITLRASSVTRTRTPFCAARVSLPEQDWVPGDFHHAGFAAVLWGWLKAEDAADVDAEGRWGARTAEQGSLWKLR
jgi:hypothetical protein